MINEELIKQVLIEQRDLLKSTPEFVNRELLKNISKIIFIKHIVVVTGHRRSGKSVLLSQIIHKFYGKKNIFYMNFDDERLIGLKVRDLNKLMEIQMMLFGEKKTVFLDEIQNIDKWERFVSRLYNEGYKIYITGSNAKLLSSELTTLLTGRHMDIDVYPFSFTEFLKYRGLEFKEKMLYRTSAHAKLRKHFDVYLHNGGFPEVVQSGYMDILKKLFTDVITKDVIRRYEVRDIRAMDEVAHFLLSNAAKEFSYNRIKNVYALGSVHTAKNYAKYLESTFMFYELPRFSHSVKEIHGRIKKIFVVDNGLIKAVGFSSSADIGRLYENLVFMELKRRQKEFYYYKEKTGEEVDFIIKKGRKIQECIQVCYKIDEFAVRRREISGLLKAVEEFKLNKGTIITADKEESISEKGKKIEFIPLWKWLLKGKSL